jgi:hypothetical protein
VFYQNDAYGKAGLDGVTLALGAQNLKPVAQATVERNTVDVAAAVKTLVAAGPDAVVQIGAYKACAAFIREARKAGYGGTFYNVSFVGTQALADELGKDGAGVVVSQVMPSPYNTARPIAREFVEAVKAAGKDAQINFSSMEGYVAAKVLVDGLKRGGAKISRESLISGLEAIGTPVAGRVLGVVLADRPRGVAASWSCRCSQGRSGQDLITRSPSRSQKMPDLLRRFYSGDLPRGDQPAHELLATRQLLQTHKLIRLVRLVDAAGAAHHGGNAGILEEARFGAEGDQRGLFGAGKPLRQLRHRVAGRAQESGHLANRLKAETRVGRYLFHSWLLKRRIG